MVHGAGRSLASSGFDGDTGSADPALAAALAGGDAEAVVAALASSRVLVPVVAVLGETGTGATGPDGRRLTTDKSADMAVVTLAAPDGRQTMPVFSSTAALAAWDPSARPVPVDARTAALSAVDEGCQLLVVDPAGAAVVVLRPALWALAQGRGWTPSPRHPDVAAALAALAGAEPDLAAARGEPGERAELRVVLAVRPGLDRDGLGALTARVSQALAASDAVAEHVDSLELRVVPA